jgi:hypothetical protein
MGAVRDPALLSNLTPSGYKHLIGSTGKSCGSEFIREDGITNEEKCGGYTGLFANEFAPT